jgi:hypothetical protein
MSLLPNVKVLAKEFFYRASASCYPSKRACWHITPSINAFHRPSSSVCRLQVSVTVVITSTSRLSDWEKKPKVSDTLTPHLVSQTQRWNPRWVTDQWSRQSRCIEVKKLLGSWCSFLYEIWTPIKSQEYTAKKSQEYVTKNNGWLVLLLISVGFAGCGAGGSLLQWHLSGVLKKSRVCDEEQLWLVPDVAVTMSAPPGHAQKPVLASLVATVMVRCCHDILSHHSQVRV